MRGFQKVLLRLFVALGLLLGGSIYGFGQTILLSNLVQRTFSVAEDSLCLGGLTILPATVSVRQLPGSKLLDSTYYRLEGHCLILRKPLPLGDSLQVTYRALPVDLGRHYRWVDSVEVGAKPEEVDIAFDFTDEASKSVLPDLKGLDYQGSFARGFTLGNNQSLVLNSSFNLRMAGKIANDLEIKAAITDENIPIQPEGNTQELREFDKIFIQLRKGTSSLTAGDYELKSHDSYFLKYYKKLQGATVETSFPVGTESTINLRGSVAIPKGQFARNTLTPSEGNQGPYALQGNNGERFLIILSATERVFLDGRLLKRGIDEDYVIDYNRGVVTFTARNLITKDSRIVVEFEYADQRFQKSLMAADAEWKYKKWNVFFNFMTSQDSKLTGGAKDLSKEEKIILAQAGDDLAQAFVSGIDTINHFTPEIVTYEIVDTMGFSGVLRYSTDQTKTLVKARFSDVGAGHGHYIISQSAANGRVYEWVAPDSATGMLLGNYEPVISLTAPELHQVFSMGTEGAIGKHLNFQSEVSLSRKDLNRFSELDKGDDTGLAAKISLTHSLPFGKKKASPKLETKMTYEWVSGRYRSLTPFRQTEFSRDWNLSSLENSADEQLPDFSLKYVQPDWGHFQYLFSGYSQKGVYDGQKHSLDFQLDHGRVRWISGASLLHSKSQLERTQFLRPRTDLSVSFLNKLGKVPGRVGVIWEQEDNRRFTEVTGNQLDTLSLVSRHYDFYKLYLEMPSGKKFKSGFFVSQRKDFVPGRLVSSSLAGQFLQSTDAVDLAWQGKWLASKASRLSWQLTRRQLSITQQALTNQKPQNTWLGKLDYYFKLPKGLLLSTTTYELGSGQAPKIEYNYLKVDPGQGSFTWIDRNNDSIPQLDEFEVAPFADQADFLRVSIVTNEFVPTNNVRFNQSIRFNPKKYLSNKKGILKFAGRLSTISSVRLFRRLLVLPKVASWNPFAQAVDSALVTTDASVLNTLYFDKGSPKFEWQIGQKSSRHKSLLTSGANARSLEQYFSKVRYRVSRSLNVQLEGAQEKQKNESKLFEQRNFNIKNRNGRFSLTHVHDRRLRNIVSYAYEQKANKIGAQESMVSHQLKWELTLTGKPKQFDSQRPIRLRADFSIVKIDFDGAAGSSVGYTMLEGLQPGQNLLWGVSIDKQLTKSMILSLLYNGRQTGTKGKPVHVGSMQARAIF